MTLNIRFLSVLPNVGCFTSNLNKPTASKRNIDKYLNKLRVDITILDKIVFINMNFLLKLVTTNTNVFTSEINTPTHHFYKLRRAVLRTKELQQKQRFIYRPVQYRCINNLKKIKVVRGGHS